MSEALILALRVLQGLAGLAWLAVAVPLLPGLIRVWRRTADKLDAQRSTFFWFAVLQVGFSGHWFIWPQAIAERSEPALLAWASLYLLSGMLAVNSFIRHIEVERGR